jgi:hypothetical protein
MATSEPPTGLTRPTRHESARMLIEHSWARPHAPRPAARPHVVLMVAVFVAAGAIGVGAVLQWLRPIRLAEAAASPPPPPAPAAPFTAVGGWDCGSGGGNSGFVVQGRTSSWYTVASGGWAYDGCHGTFEAIPMTGNTAGTGPDQVAEWWFTPGPAMTRCAVMVFRPAPQRRQDAAATAAQFNVLSGQGGTPLAGFVVNEAADPGSWATAGTFPVSPDGIAVALVDRGVPTIAGGSLAITQVKVTCTG